MIGTPLSTLFNDNRIKAATSHVFLVGGYSSSGELTVLHPSTLGISRKSKSSYAGLLIAPDYGSPFIMALEGISTFYFNEYSYKTTDTIRSKSVDNYRSAMSDFDGSANTDFLIEFKYNDKDLDEYGEEYSVPWAKNYSNSLIPQGNWYLPSLGQVMQIWKYKNEIAYIISRFYDVSLNLSSLLSSTLVKTKISSSDMRIGQAAINSISNTASESKIKTAFGNSSKYIAIPVTDYFKSL